MKKIGAEPVQGIILLEIPKNEEDTGLILTPEMKKQRAKAKQTIAEGLVIAAAHSSSDYKAGDRVIIDDDKFGNIILTTSEGIEQFYMSFESAIVMKITPISYADTLPQN